jgi:hypothetical protein
MIYFRPRREWPEFYGTGIENLINLNVGTNQQRNEIGMPIVNFNITNENIFDTHILNFF